MGVLGQKDGDGFLEMGSWRWDFLVHCIYRILKFLCWSDDFGSVWTRAWGWEPGNRYKLELFCWWVHDFGSIGMGALGWVEFYIFCCSSHHFGSIVTGALGHKHEDASLGMWFFGSLSFEIFICWPDYFESIWMGAWELLVPFWFFTFADLSLNDDNLYFWHKMTLNSVWLSHSQDTFLNDYRQHNICIRTNHRFMTIQHVLSFFFW